jgi:hypothetical protein
VSFAPHPSAHCCLTGQQTSFHRLALFFSYRTLSGFSYPRSSRCFGVSRNGQRRERAHPVSLPQERAFGLALVPTHILTPPFSYGVFALTSLSWPISPALVLFICNGYAAIWALCLSNDLLIQTTYTFVSARPSMNTASDGVGP